MYLSVWRAMMPKNVTNRRALKTLQSVAGLYGLVVACEEVQFPGQLVGHFSGGEVLRAILPKEVGKNPKEIIGHDTEGGNVGAMGYGVQMTFDVVQGKHNGNLCVRVCWHDIVYLSQVDFGKKQLAF
jgi:hypothetical protein